MSMVAVILAEGFEEIEALTTVDVLRRAKIEVKTLSLNGVNEVKGSRNIKVVADGLFEDINKEEIDMLVLPGGMDCRNNMAAHEGLKETLLAQNKSQKKIAAICAAPTVLGRIGILEGIDAVCYPGELEKELKGRVVPEMGVTTVTCENITTSSGPATAMEFALELVRVLKGEKIAEEVASGLLY